MPKHPRTLAGVVLSTSALLVLGLPAAAEEQATTAAPATDECATAPEQPAADPAAEEAPPADGEPDGEVLDPADDVDGDGVRDEDDDDADGDGEPDAAPQTAEDVDGDGVRDAEDGDADGDGTPDDRDADGVPDAEDPDVDGDGLADAEQAEAADETADGAAAGDDAAAGEDPAANEDPAAGDGAGAGDDAAAGERSAGGDGAAGGECAAPAGGEPAAPTGEAAAPEGAHEPHAANDAPGAPVDVPPPPAEEAVDPTPPSLDDVPADVLAEIAAYPRTPAGSTTDLVEALRPLAAAGLGADEIAAVGFGRFPVGGEATWIHDWLFPRYVPSFHTHEGIDIFADRGTPVRAPADGIVHVSNGSIGGLAVKVVEADGTYWYMSHLDAVVAGIDGARVTAGTVVGAVGDSGNARGGSPHVHLQLHPGGGEPVDPKPVIDLLAAEALAGVPSVLARHSGPSVVFSGFTWEPATAAEPKEAGRDPILDLLLPLARLADEPEHDHEHESGHGPEDE